MRRPAPTVPAPPAWHRRGHPLVERSDDIHCRILFADEVLIDPSWRVQMGDPFWRLYSNREDGAQVTGVDGSRPIPASRLVLVPAWCRLHSGCRGPVLHRFVHFDPMGLGGDWVREHCPHPIILPAGEGREERFAALFAARDGAVPARLRLQALVLEVLAEALAALPARSRERLDQHRAHLDRVAPALRLIEEELAGRLGTERLASRCGLSPDHFARIFRERMGQSPARYLQERRIGVAAERLLAGDEDIARIAAACGFANRYHFTRVFAARMGMPPAAYRRAGRW